MEFENLKASWEQQTNRDFRLSIENWKELVHNRSYGPLAALKNKFRKQLLAFPAFVGIIVWDFFRRPELLHDAGMWFFILLVFLLTLYFGYNYRLIRRLQDSSQSIRKSVENDIYLLEAGLKKYQLVSRLVILMCIPALEIMMAYHQLPAFEEWHKQPAAWRGLFYVLLLLAQYWVSKRAFEQQFGRHINYCRDILKNADE